MEKHKHCDLIKAWAEGAMIEYKAAPELWLEVLCPSWDEDYEYRIKPEPKPDVIYYACFDEKDVLNTTDHAELDSCITKYHDERLDSLKLTFDGETGKLKSAEVIS